jgi:putative endonuclease
MCITYILHSESLDSFYIGSTSSGMEQRLKKHLTNHKGYTSKAKDWIVVFQKQFENIADARGLERKLKNWKNKNSIQQFIHRSNNLQ